MRKTITTKNKGRILSIEEISRFIEYLDLALRNASTDMLKEIFEGELINYCRCIAF